MSVEIKQVDLEEHNKFIKKLWDDYNSETGSIRIVSIIFYIMNKKSAIYI